MGNEAEGLRKLYLGEFNDMMTEGRPDGSKIITLTSRKDPEVYRFRVRGLYGSDEELLDIDTGEPLR